MKESLNKLKKILKSVRELTTIGSANIVGGLISAVFWLFLAGIMGAEDYGEVSYFIAIASLAFTICFLGAGNTIVVFTAKYGKTQSSIYFLSLIAGVIMSVLLFFIFYKIGMSLFVIGSMIFGLTTFELLGRKLYGNYFKYMFSQRVLLLVIGIGLYYVFGTDGVILGYALSFFPFFPRLYRAFRKTKIDFAFLKRSRNFILHSYALDISRNFPLFADKLILFPLFGLTLLGNYQVGVQFIILLGILPMSVYQYLLPKDAQGEKNMNLKIASVLASVVLAILGMLLAPLIVPILFPSFHEAVLIIQIMSWGIIPITINHIYSSKFFGIGKSKIVMLGAVVFMVIQFLGILIIGQIYGINGAAISFVLGSISQSIFYYSINRKMPKNN